MTTARSPLVRTDGLSRAYSLGATAVRALEGLTMDIDRGEFVAIMGPSGSGKSTCMHVLGCLDRPTEGRYVLDDIDVSGLRPDALATIRNEKIGFVFQSFSLLGRQSALENVQMPLLYAGMARRERQKRARAALDAVGLSDRLHHRPNQLSGGQQQRVAIARAIVNEPAMILADEPTGALDTRTGLEIMALLQSLHDRGITVVVVTHDPELARFASRILHFRDGHLVSDERTEAPLSARAALADLDDTANSAPASASEQLSVSAPAPGPAPALPLEAEAPLLPPDLPTPPTPENTMLAGADFPTPAADSGTAPPVAADPVTVPPAVPDRAETPPAAPAVNPGRVPEPAPLDASWFDDDDDEVIILRPITSPGGVDLRTGTGTGTGSGIR